MRLIEASQVEITRHDIDGRFKSLTSDFYSQMVFLMKGAVLTVAATALMTILQHPSDARGAVDQRLVFFAASIPVVLVTVVTYRRGLLLATPRITFVDYLAPFGMGAAEVAAFMILIPESALGAGILRGDLDYRLVWFLVAGIHALFAVCLVANRILFTWQKDFSDDLRKLVGEYKTWLVGDLIGATVMSAGALLVFLRGAQLGFGEPLSRSDLVHQFVIRVNAPAWLTSVDGFTAAAIVLAMILLGVSAKALEDQMTLWRRLKLLPVSQ